MPDPIVPTGAPVPSTAPTAETPAAPPVVPDESQLGDAGKAALQVERDARAAEKARADAAEAKLKDAEDAKLSDIDRANRAAADTATENAKLKSDNARLAALAEHPVPKEYQDLVTGTDEASFLASAKKISDLYAKAEGKAPLPDPIPRSRELPGGPNPSGGSTAAGRDLYAAQHPKINS